MKKVGRSGGGAMYGGGDMVRMFQITSGIVVVGAYALYKWRRGEESVEEEKVNARKPRKVGKGSRNQGLEQDQKSKHESRPSWVSDQPQVSVQDVMEHASWVSRTSTIGHEAETNQPSWASKQSLSDVSTMHTLASWKSSPQSLDGFDDESKTSVSFESKDGSSIEEDEKHDRYNDEEEDEEEVFPSWMSRKDPVLSKRDAGFALKFGAESRKQLGTVEEFLSETACKLSDTVYVYPVGRESFFGETAVEFNDRNVDGHAVQVKLMQTRAGAGSAVLGSLQGGSKSTVLASSSALKSMLPTMFEIASERLATVFHVAASKVGDDLTITSDLSDITRVRDTGFAILGSSTSQDALDMALVAHVVSHQTATPFLHYFDGVRSLHELSTLSPISKSALNVAKSMMPRHFVSSAEMHGVDLPTVVQRTMNQLGSALGKTYKILEYSGPANPQGVIVALGTVAHVVEQAISQLPNNTVGVLNVRLLRPWSASHFIHTLPVSARRICVLDNSGAQFNPLFLDVASALHSHVGNTENAHLVISGKVVGEFSTGMAHSVVSNLMAAHPQTNFVASVLHSHLDVQNIATHGKKQIKEIVVWTSGHAQGKLATETISKMASLFATHSKNNVQHHTSTDPYSGDCITRNDLRLSPSRNVPLPQGFAIHDADVVMVDERVLAHAETSVADCLGRGSVLLINGDGAVAAQFSGYMKSVISGKSVTVLTVDPSRHENLDASASQLAGIAAALHLLGAKPQSHYHALTNCEELDLENRKAVQELLNSGISSYISSTKITQHHSFFNTRGGIASPTSTAIDFDTASVVSAPRQGIEFRPRIEASEKVLQGNGKNMASNALATNQPVTLSKSQVALALAFKENFKSEPSLRPNEHEAYQVRVTTRKRLTPSEGYDRDIFHISFDLSGTLLKYEIGDSLGVFPHNDESEVNSFLEAYGLNPDQFVALPRQGRMRHGSTQMITIKNLFTQHLDLFGKPSKKFYSNLARFAKSRYEHLRLLHIATDDTESFKLGVYETVTYADVLVQYKSARPCVEVLAEMIPFIKPRHYSIASSMKLNPRSVDLLVIAVDWVTPLGKKRYGAATRYLNQLKKDELVTVNVMTSVMRLPPSTKQPIIMAGLGTGLAPFRAFVQERKWQKEQGFEVGPVALYFGSRHRSKEYLYGDEWDAYSDEQLITDLGLAFSRDQPHKIYIQDLIRRDGDTLRKYFEEQNGYFYLCGPTHPVPAVRDAIASGLSPDPDQGVEKVEKLKEQGRYILEVY